MYQAQLVGLMSGHRYPGTMIFNDRGECERWVANSNKNLPPLTRWRLMPR